LNGFDSQISRLFCPIGVYFNSVATCRFVPEQAGKSRAISNAGIKRRKFGIECQAASETFCFLCWEEEAKFGFALRTA
jgi:hypothetical protein